MDCHTSQTQQSLETLLGMQEREKGKMRYMERVRTTDELRGENERERLGSSNETSAAEMFPNAIST
jgi:hypothetical protein